MNAAELDALLRQFLVDHKLSVSEREVLTSWVNNNVDTDQKRAAARGRVFEAARNVANGSNAGEVITFLEDVMKVLQPLTPADRES